MHIAHTHLRIHTFDSKMIVRVQTPSQKDEDTWPFIKLGLDSGGLPWPWPGIAWRGDLTLDNPVRLHAQMHPLASKPASSHANTNTHTHTHALTTHRQTDRHAHAHTSTSQDKSVYVTNDRHAHAHTSMSQDKSVFVTSMQLQKITLAYLQSFAIVFIHTSL